MSLFIFSFACIGMTQILVYGKIFDKLRPTYGWPGELASCPMCMGFWVGIFLWAISDSTGLFIFDDSWVTALVLGCYSSVISYFGSMLVDDSGLKLSRGE